MNSDMQDAQSDWQFSGNGRGYEVSMPSHRSQRKRRQSILFASFLRFMAQGFIRIRRGRHHRAIDRRVPRGLLWRSGSLFPGLRSWVGFRQTGIFVHAGPL